MADVSGTFTVDGNSDEITFKHSRDASPGIYVHFDTNGGGTFGGGTIQLQFKNSDGVFKDFAGAAYTDDTDKLVSVPRNTTIRAVLSGSTSPSIYWQLTDFLSKAQ